MMCIGLHDVYIFYYKDKTRQDKLIKYEYTFNLIDIPNIWKMVSDNTFWATPFFITYSRNKKKQTKMSEND